MTTPEDPTPEDPRTPDPEEREQAAPPAGPVDPQDALKGLGEQPRIDEQGYPTAYTAVPPPLGEQQQPQSPEEWQQQGHGGQQQPPQAQYGQQPQQPRQPPNGQQYGYGGQQPQPGYGQQQPQQPQQSPYGQQSQQQPQYGQPPQQQPQYGQPTGHADANSPFGASHGGQQPQDQGAYASAQHPGGQAQGQPQDQNQNQPGAQGQAPGQGQTQAQQSGYGAYPPPPPPGYSTYGAPGGEGGVPGMPPYARWGQRAGAWLVDNLIAVIGLGLLDSSYYRWGHGIRVIGWIIAVVGVVWAIYNAYLAGQTGQSTGKSTAGIRLARYVDGQVVGPAFGLLRLFMNVVFWVICFIPGLLNYLWPLWDRKSQTWSDKIASSVVVQAR